MNTKTISNTHKPPVFSLKALFAFVICSGVALGAYLVFTGQAANPNLPGDVNNDNKVDVTDLNVLKSHYNTTDTTADLNSDTKTNILDLSVLLAHYGQILNGGGGGSAFKLPQIGISLGSKIMGRSDSAARFELDQSQAVGAKVIRIDYAEWSYARADSFVIPEIIKRGMIPDLEVGGQTGYRDLTAVAQKAVNTYGHSVIYETMNEPDLQGWTAQQIGQQVKVIGSTIKAKDPQAFVIAGALWKEGAGPQANVSAMYAAGAKPYFDAISLHLYDDPYSRGTWNIWDMTFPLGTFSTTVRSVMNANGDSAKPIVSTENGGPVNKYGNDGQASIISHDFDALSDEAHFPGFNMQLVYTMEDDDVPGFGLLNPDLTKRPSWSTYQQRAPAFQ